MSCRENRWLEQAVYDTVRYFDLFRMPVTSVQVWRSLIVDREGRGTRWQGKRVPSLSEVVGALSRSEYVRARVSSKWGFFYLRSSVEDRDGGVQQYIKDRLVCYSLAQQKWKLAQRVVRRLSGVPFVRMIAVSGSLAMSNTGDASDLDLFVIVKKGRVWTARMLMLLAAQLMGRRRKHWDEAAPNKACINHFVTDEGMLMPVDVRNLYTAIAYVWLVPLFGRQTFKRWHELNEGWFKQWVMYPEAEYAKSRLGVKVSPWSRKMKDYIEGLLLEPVGDKVEEWSGRVQRNLIVKHTKPAQWGRVVISPDELAFHPNTVVPGLLREFNEEEGQKQFL